MRKYQIKPREGESSRRSAVYHDGIVNRTLSSVRQAGKSIQIYLTAAAIVGLTCLAGHYMVNLSSVELDRKNNSGRTESVRMDSKEINSSKEVIVQTPEIPHDPLDEDLMEEEGVPEGMEFDKRGTIEKRVDSDRDGVADTTQKTVYDDNGELLEEVTETDTNLDGVIASRRTIRYKDGLVVEELETKTERGISKTDEAITIVTKRTIYNEDGNLTMIRDTEVDKDGDGKVDSKCRTTSTMDNRFSNTTEETDLDGDNIFEKRSTSYFSMTDINAPKSRIDETDTDSNGIIDERWVMEDVDSQRKVIHESDLDQNGVPDRRIITTTNHKEDGTAEEVKEDDFDGNGQINSKTTTIYKGGKALKRVKEAHINNDGIKDISTEIFRYGEDGIEETIIKDIDFNGDGTVQQRITTTYVKDELVPKQIIEEFDEFGNLTNRKEH